MNYSRLAAYNSQPYTGSLGNGTFQTTITATPSAYYGCCDRLRLTFRLKLDSSGPRAKAVEVGYLTADIVDKTMELTGKEEGDVAAGRPLWVTELCRDEDDKKEVACQSRTLFNRGGARRPHLYRFAQQLTGNDRLVHIDTFRIEAAYRSGKGIGAVALASFHALLPQLSGGHAYSGTVLLSPGVLWDIRPDFPGMDDGQIVQKLTDVYIRNGYRVIVRDPEHVRDKMVIMSITV